MKKTQEQIDAFTAELKAVCEKHRLGIVGTCENEGIYGEISIVDLDDPWSCGWDTVQSYMYNFVVDFEVGTNT